ncbi:hypothetical protein ACLOJK_040830 [Asimina triloba]
MEMESQSQSITSFCEILSSFCNHVQSTSQALHDSVHHRRPLPLDSASFTFIQSLNRRISSAAPDLNHLHSMLLETVSFQELLAHCNQLYHQNHAHLLQLSDRLHMKPGPDDEDQEALGFATPVAIDSNFLTPDKAISQLSLPSPSLSLRKRLQEDPLFDDSMCLQDLGLSDIGLATLAAGEILHADAHFFSFRFSLLDRHSFLRVSMVLKRQSDLQVVVEKMNSILCRQDRSADGHSFSPDDIASLELGAKGRSYLLMLLRMNRLVVETVAGSISYRVII